MQGDYMRCLVSVGDPQRDKSTLPIYPVNDSIQGVSSCSIGNWRIFETGKQKDWYTTALNNIELKISNIGYLNVSSIY